MAIRSASGVTSPPPMSLLASSPTASTSTAIWPRSRWHAHRAAHEERVASWADAFVDRRSRNATHPVHDFLFTYFSFSPAKLKQWLPPLAAAIEVTEDDLPALRAPAKSTLHYRDGFAELGVEGITTGTRDLARWIAQMCDNVLDRAPRFRCYGLHEWAMVYRQSAEQVRHQGYELRLAPSALASFVESQVICCSHYDAFRFFTPAARPMNVLQPTLETRLENEQGACLHANMDLYKWATKLWPWVGSDFVGKAFALALEGRDLDMRASPYDLRHLGFEPVPIETTAGREQYETEQRALAEKAVPLREELRAIALRIAS